MRKILLYTALFLGLMACNQKQEKKTESKAVAMNVIKNEDQMKEKREVTQVIKTLFGESDKRNWEAVKATMADSVYVDYSALEGASEFQKPDAIVNGWQALLPGFERTIHQIHNVSPWVADDRATATFDAIATHYLEGEQWTVFVGYDTEFIKQNDTWKLARIDLSLYDQTGNTELPKKAMEVVKNNKVIPFTKTSKAKETVEQFFTSLENQNLDAFMAIMDANVVQHMPFAPESFPQKFDGEKEMRDHHREVVTFKQSYNREYLPLQNENEILVKFSGAITTEEGERYNNYYVNLFKLKNGKIIEIIEMFNPNILLDNFPGQQAPHYSVHNAGASTESGVLMEEVRFPSSGLNLVGHLFLPPNFKATQQYPTAIVTGSWTSVKEQMPDEYASLLAKEGFIALTFDFTGFGESEGQPRQVEDYKLKINDIKAAIDFLEGHKNVDMNRLSGLGVCASSGYMAQATAQDDRIKNLILVAPWLHNAEIAKSLYDVRPGGTDGLLASARAAKEKYAETGEMEYVLAASELDPLSAMYVPRNAFDYYLNPAKAAGKHYNNLFAVTSWEPWLTFDGIAAGKDIGQPVFIVHSESGAVPQGAKRFYELLEGKKDIKWLNEYNQQQLYFEEEAVSAAMNEVVDYLR